MEQVLLLFCNTIIAAIVSAITAALINKLQQDRAYKQEYYKEIIAKRMRIYERIENQIAVMNSAVADGGKYHLFFNSNFDDFHEYQRNMFFALSYSIWLSEEMNGALSELNQLFLKINEEISDDIDQNIELGKRYYGDINACKHHIADVLQNDFLTLHEVEKFLKKKKEKKNKHTTTATHYPDNKD